jgi:glycosyltransferase involved in cell wall biosynthesis
MKILILSTFDTSGGAARAAYRTNQGLRNAGMDSQMLVRKKSSEDIAVQVQGSNSNLAKVLGRLQAELDRIVTIPYVRSQQGGFSSQWVPDGLCKRVLGIEPDIVNLHWTCNGYLQIETLRRLNSPIVWTLHDMWAFTGGCHYAQGCDRYQTNCGQCPQLNSHTSRDLSRWVWNRKRSVFKDIDLTVVTPSRWLARCAESSSLFENVSINVIPNGIDTSIYKPYSKNEARKILGLPLEKKLILFGSANPKGDHRKGFHLLQLSLSELSQTAWQNSIEVCIFGTSSIQCSLNLGFKEHFTGNLSDDATLSLVYSAADVFVAPSTQDNLPNTVMEALACGTPCVAFDIGGMPDMIDHKKNGYLAKPFETKELAEGIAWILEDSQRHDQLCRTSREKVMQEFTLSIHADRYRILFEKILAGHK